jgi:hypothetical protein
MILAVIGIYTFAIVYIIHHYENKLNKHNIYSNAQHYTQLQLDNIDLKRKIKELTK